MVEAFAHCKEHLIQFGGHAKAAGFTMEISNYDAFLSCFTDFLQEKDYTPLPEATAYDLALEVSELSEKNWQKLEPLLPWGQMHPEPMILLKNTKLSQLSHLNLDLANLPVPKDEKVDMIVLWRSASQLRMLSVLPK